MPNCNAFGCTNRSSDNAELSFHKMPSEKNNLLRKQWLHNIRRDGKLPKDSGFFICSEHFEEHCFVRDLQAELMGERRRRNLIKDAVPTLFCFNEKKKRVSSERRSNTATKKQENAPSPAYSSDSNDQEFAVTAEMMVSGEDYENTLDDEEELEEDDEDELSDLQKEGDMPLEELLKMYYGNSNSAEEEKDIVLEDGAKEKEKPELDKMEDETSRSSSELVNGNENGDGDNPFFNQRITRGLAALNSQYFDEDYSSDEDYQPTAEDWKKEIQIGMDHQAIVSDGLDHYKPNEKTVDVDDKLLWNPDSVAPVQLRRYLNTVYKLTDANTADRDDEQALYTLLQMRDVDRALIKRQEQEKRPPEVSLWSEEECQNFEQGLRVFGKDFRLIQKNKVQSRTVGEIVQFYYLWKKTERHDAFVTQTKLGRRKYTLPGIADMMGRFMEETESMFSSRSGSPNVDPQNLIQNNLNIKQELTDKSLKSENSYHNYNNYHHQPYYGTLKQNNGNSNNESWRTSPTPISIGSVN